jgi:hypothetical protein
MDPKVTVSNDAVTDIRKLATGVDRVAVALEALQDAKLDHRQIENLRALLARYESPEAKLRTENRIQDDPAILTKLGFRGTIPAISPELMTEAARTNGTLVLDFGVSLVDYAKALNAALGRDKSYLHLKFCGGAEKTTFATKSSGNAPQWKIVPNAVREDTLSLSKVDALKHIPGSQTSEPRDTALMLGYNNLQTGAQMPGFVDRYTFTSQKNTLVGSYGRGVLVLVDDDLFDGDGSSVVGLAPRLAPESI